MKQALLISYCIILVAALLCLCGKSPTQPQAGSETTNGMVIASVKSGITGTTAPFAKVYVYASDYTPDHKTFADSVAADSKGAFWFNNLPAGQYNVFAFPSDSLLGGSILNIHVETSKIQSDSVQFDSLTTISGVVLYENMPHESACVYVPGSFFQTYSNAEGAFVLKRVPEGKYQIHARYTVRDIYTVLSDSQNVDTTIDGTDAFVTFTLKPMEE